MNHSIGYPDKPVSGVEAKLDALLEWIQYIKEQLNTSKDESRKQMIVKILMSRASLFIYEFSKNTTNLKKH